MDYKKTVHSVRYSYRECFDDDCYVPQKIVRNTGELIFTRESLEESKLEEAREPSEESRESSTVCVRYALGVRRVPPKVIGTIEVIIHRDVAEIVFTKTN